MDKFDKYLSITRAARRRYTVRGVLVVSIGGRPSRYTQIEQWAFARYLAYGRQAQVGAVPITYEVIK